MLKNIKFTGKIASEPTSSENGEFKFLLDFNRRCLTELGTMEHRREVAEIVIHNAPKLQGKLIKGKGIMLQGDLTLTNQNLNPWSTPVLTLIVNSDNGLHFVAIAGD